MNDLIVFNNVEFGEIRSVQIDGKISNLDEIIRVSDAKREKRGGFDKRIFLERRELRIK